MIAIIKGMGSNLNSVLFCLQRLNISAELTTDPEKICKASHVILPGVGHAGYGMEQLKKLNLLDTIKSLQQPVLGICLGMQLLFSHSTEGNVDCLDIIPGTVTALIPTQHVFVPHMGWNQLTWNVSQHLLQNNIDAHTYFYFVHSYVAPVGDYTLARCTHGVDFSAIVSYRNFYGMQFHPERSGKVGEQLLRNWFNIL